MSQGTSLHPHAFRDEKAERMSGIDVDPNRSNFARDRDRILYSRCFRRLAHKTQVYLTSEGKEHARMRLTHTLEVTQVARTIARRLGMNEDLVEAISLGHDVGHAPFGHAGEHQIQRFLQNDHPPPRHMCDQMTGRWHDAIPKCDFKHNFQSVRLLSTLERYDSDGGLNLMLQCLEGILKHTRIFKRGDSRAPYVYPDTRRLFARLMEVPAHRTIESQIVAVADELSQVAHDLADAVLYRQIEFTALAKAKTIVTILGNTQKGQRLRDFYIAGVKSEPTLASHLASALITFFVNESVERARKRLLEVSDLASCPQLWPDHVPDPSPEFTELKQYKDRLVVNCYDVNRMDNKGAYVLRQLIDAYVSDPRQLPDAAFSRYRVAIEGTEWSNSWRSAESYFARTSFITASG